MKLRELCRAGTKNTRAFGMVCSTAGSLFARLGRGLVATKLSAVLPHPAIRPDRVQTSREVMPALSRELGCAHLHESRSSVWALFRSTLLLVLGTTSLTAASAATIDITVLPKIAYSADGFTACWRRPKTEPLMRVVPTQN